MTESSTVDELTAERREQAAVVLRVVADLHAAYGRHVGLTIQMADEGETGHGTWLHLRAPLTGPGLTVGFWDDGEVTISGKRDVAWDHLTALALAREFIHQHGHGAR
jgi:hypothetical protein